VAWITNYLTGQPQYVRPQSNMSDTIVSNTGAPQGTVLFPFLFTLYNSDFRYCSQSCHLQKFSDDSAIVGCISKGQESEYRSGGKFCGVVWTKSPATQHHKDYGVCGGFEEETDPPETSQHQGD